VSERAPRTKDRVRTAEVVAALSLATDLGMRSPLEHGVRSAVIATRLGDILGVDLKTRAEVSYASLLFYIGCTTSARTASEAFAEDFALTTYAVPLRFGSPSRMAAGMGKE
jgi:hypothetical protein